MVKKTNAKIPYSLDDFPKVLPQVKFFTEEPVTQEIRAFVGWDGIVIFDQKLDILQTLKIYAKQYQNYAQSCGRCLPGKYGGKVLYELMEKLQNHEYSSDDEALADIFKLYEVCELMQSTSKCEVGKTTPNPILQVLREKPEVFAAILPSSRTNSSADSKESELSSLVLGLQESAKKLQEARDFVNRVQKSITSGVSGDNIIHEAMQQIESIKEEQGRSDLKESLITAAKRIARGEIKIFRESACHSEGCKPEESKGMESQENKEMFRFAQHDKVGCHSDLERSENVCHSEAVAEESKLDSKNMDCFANARNDEFGSATTQRNKLDLNSVTKSSDNQSSLRGSEATEAIHRDSESQIDSVNHSECIDKDEFIQKESKHYTQLPIKRTLTINNDTESVFEDIERYKSAITTHIGSSTYISKITAPCTDECPSRVDIPAYIEGVKDMRFLDSLSSTRGSMPLAQVCGRVCPHPCENACRRAILDEPISIMELKRIGANAEIASKKSTKWSGYSHPIGYVKSNNAADSLASIVGRDVSPTAQHDNASCHSEGCKPEESKGMESKIDSQNMDCFANARNDESSSATTQSNNNQSSLRGSEATEACSTIGANPHLQIHIESTTQIDSANKQTNSSNCSMALNVFTEKEGRSYLSDNDYPSFSVNHLNCIDKDEFNATKINNKSVGVIGAGPAGLSTAYYLALRGIQVVVYEALPVLGGEVAVGVPNYRMPIVEYNHDIESLKELGVVFRTNYEVNATNILDLERSHNALVLAVGTRASKRLGCKNENVNLSGYLPAIKFMDSVNLAQKFSIGELPNLSGKKVVCVGGGFTSMDVVRCCVRLGASSVIMLYRRDEATIIKNTSAEEYHEAVEEGVVFQFLSAVDEIIEEDSKIKSLKINRYELIKSENSPKGELKLIEDGGMILECDILIPAVSQEMDFNLDSNFGVNITKWKTIEVDNASFATTKKGIFAAGDCVSGPLTIVNAVGQGRRVASVVSNYLTTGEVAINDDEKMEDLLKSIGVFDKNREIKGFLSGNKREVSKKLNPEYRAKNFDEVNLGFHNEEAISEAQRCMRCYYISMCVVGNVAQGGTQKEGLA